MLLTGHGGEVYTAKFHPRGNLLASAGVERQIFLWNVYGECDNINVMSGHTGAISAHIQHQRRHALHGKRGQD